jgi:aflatoxin B1 aldehyde reductase
MSNPCVILGTMTFSSQTDKATSKTMIEGFIVSPLSGNMPHLDSARMYGGGKTEELLGELLTEDPSLSDRCTIATKANPFGEFTLTAEGVRGQCDATLAALQTLDVNLFYLHAPDAAVNIEETLQSVQSLFEAGKFKRFGLSNYTAWETVWIHNYMTSKGWVVPTVYQGMMNAITRKTNEELLPALRRLGMSFYAYNPLAGGMLTGKHVRGGDTGSGRFTSDQMWGQIYQRRFMQEKQFDAMDIILNACGANNVEPYEAALRWMMHHSGLSSAHGDGIIIGASKLEYFEANMSALSKGPLSEGMIAAYDEAWEICRPIAPEFQRGVSGSA